MNLSDEFNGTSVNTTLWHVFDCTVDPFYCVWGSSTGMNPSMTTESGGYLNLRTDGNVCPTCDSYNYPTGSTQYNTGGIQSQEQNTNLEKIVKLPPYCVSSPKNRTEVA